MNLYNANKFQEVLERFIRDNPENILDDEHVKKFARICIFSLLYDENPSLIPPIIRAAKHLHIKPNAAAIKEYLNKAYEKG